MLFPHSHHHFFTSFFPHLLNSYNILQPTIEAP
ncbi:hypothetical protein LINGRAHAP2_LOCUS34909 [Linum grandiflorum]